MSGTGAPQARPEDSTPGVGAGSLASRVALDADQIARACARMAHQILEANRGAEGLVLMGIPTRGVVLAHRLATVMDEVEGVRVPVGALDVTMYRDDLRRQPTRAVGHTHLPVEVDDSTVVLVDDVLYSGRTVRAALDALGDLGGRVPFGWRCWWTAVTGNCPSEPIMSAPTFPPGRASTSA